VDAHPTANVGEAEVRKVLERRASLPPEEVRREVRKVLRERRDLVERMGKAAMKPLMGVLMGRLRGRADGKLVAELLREELEGI
jgi:glutamyl-tRNA(Gln) amidotransferase subunit E